MTVGTPTAGGNLIATDKIGWFDELSARLVLSRLGATMLSGLSSNTDLVGFATGVTCDWELENAQKAEVTSRYHPGKPKSNL
jgi:hypothetical protein